MADMNLIRCLSERTSKLTDEQIACELRCIEECALQSPRTRREAALLRARCLRLELERRSLQQSAVLARPGQQASV